MYIANFSLKPGFQKIKVALKRFIMTQEEFDRLIYVIHPKESIRANQKARLEKCVDDEFEFNRLFFNFGNAAYRYSGLASGSVTREDYEDWLEGLPENIAKSFRKKGIEGSQNSLALRRHILERRDVGMDEFVARLLKPEDLAKWKQYGEESNDDGRAV
ncbi:hypothetical protein [Persicitalea sp.]|uniref:hypothetical protein n=1 Tax=Persicitalea sp. TaxID=3100273 RepID=UPI003593A883